MHAAVSEYFTTCLPSLEPSQEVESNLKRPLALFYPSLILRQNFEMVLYDQATDSPTMSYTVQG